MSEDVLNNVHQVVLYLQGLGYMCSDRRVKKHIENRALAERRGGGWTRRTAEQYARVHLKRRIDADPEQDAPLGVDEPVGLQEEKLDKQSKLLGVQVQKARMNLAKELGRLVETELVEAELGKRAQAFRLGLDRFGYEQAESVAELFGGSARAARELARRLGFGEGEALDKATGVISDFCLGRSAKFTRFFAEKVEDFLDAFATGNWWTDEMKAAWERYEDNLAEAAQLPKLEEI